MDRKIGGIRSIEPIAHSPALYRAQKSDIVETATEMSSIVTFNQNVNLNRELQEP